MTLLEHIGAVALGDRIRGASRWRRRHRSRTAFTFIRLSVVGSYLFAISKLGVGILTLSLPAVANAVFSAGIGTAKLRSLRHFGTASSKDLDACYRSAGVFVIGSSAAYLAITAATLFGPENIHYPLSIAIAIALVAFIEVGVALQGALSRRLAKFPLAHANKLMNLSSAMVSLALTQTAILSFVGSDDAVLKDAIGGFVLGGCSALIGVGMVAYPHFRRDRGTGVPAAHSRTNG